MKKLQIGMVMVGSLALSSCNSLVQSVADNTPVSVLPLANATLSGSMGSSGGAAPNPAPPQAGLNAQAIYSVALSHTLSFPDFDTSTLPSALSSPSGLDIPISISGVTLACTPTASPLTLTVNTASLTVSDSVNGSQSVSVSPGIVLTLTKSVSGYSVSSNTFLLKANWSNFKPIIAKNGTDTPNTATLSLNASFNDGVAGCLATLNLASTLKQNIRY